MLFAVIHLVFLKPFSQASICALMSIINYNKQLTQYIFCIYAKIYKVELFMLLVAGTDITTTYCVSK